MNTELILFFIGKVQHPSISLGEATIKFKEKTNISKERWENTENKNS